MVDEPFPPLNFACPNATAKLRLIFLKAVAGSSSESAAGSVTESAVVLAATATNTATYSTVTNSTSAASSSPHKYSFGAPNEAKVKAALAALKPTKL